jgi:hypothetical protein
MVSVSRLACYSEVLIMQHLSRASRLIGPVLAIASLATGATASAQTPNLQPGLWSVKTSMSVQGPIALPLNTSQSEECIDDAAVERLTERLLEGLDVDGCVITEQTITASRIDYALTCRQGADRSVDLSGVMHLLGDRSHGTVSSRIGVQGFGEVSVVISHEGERLRDC